MAQEVFPSYRALQRGQNSKEVEEERRSCFVAITRVRERKRCQFVRHYRAKMADKFAMSPPTTPTYISRCLQTNPDTP